MNNFTYSIPTKIHFGKGQISHLSELSESGNKVLLCYGGGSIKKAGIYDEAVKILKEEDMEIFELSGIAPNPKIESVREGVKLCKENSIDMVLAIGGGSVIDCAKVVAAGACYDGDPWDKYFLKMEEPDCEIVPVGCVLTMAGTGSEMNAGSVITNHEQKLKIGHVFGEEVMPRFSILNPEFTMTVPQYQMISGIYDMFNHICEQYFSGTDDVTSDYLSEGLLRSVIHSSRIAVKDAKDYEARSNIMWSATWALNTLLSCGKTGDWMVHMMGQAVGGYTDATHGMTLSAVSLPYYRHILPYGLPKFKRFAENVWGVQPEGKTDEQIAREGLDRMEDWMKEIGVVLSIRDLGADESMLDGIADVTMILRGGYKKLDRQELLDIFKASLNREA